MTLFDPEPNEPEPHLSAVYNGTTGYVRGSDTSQAAEAANRADGSAETLQRLVLALLVNNPQGLTSEQAEDLLGDRRHQSVSPHLRNLELDGRVFRLRLTHRNRSGRPAHPYVHMQHRSLYDVSETVPPTKRQVVITTSIARDLALVLGHWADDAPTDPAKYRAWSRLRALLDTLNP